MTPTKNTAPTQVHPIELALVLMLGLLQQLAWLIHTIATADRGSTAAVGYRPSNPGVSVARVPLDCPAAASPAPWRNSGSAAIKPPSKQWRSARKADLLLMLAGGQEVAAVS